MAEKKFPFMAIKLSDIPVTPHYALLTESSFCVAGYDKGDPTTTEYAFNYKVFDKKDEALKEYEYLMARDPSRKDVALLHIDAKAAVEVKVKISL